MAFCTKCGNQLSEGSQFCSRCGAPVEYQGVSPEAPDHAQQTGGQQNSYTAPSQPNGQNQNYSTGTQNTEPNTYQQAQSGTQPQSQNVNWGEDHTGSFDPVDIQTNKAMAILSYIGIFVLIPIFGAKESNFARFHANQGLVNFLGSIIFGFVNAIIQFIWRIAASWSWNITPLYAVNTAVLTVINIVLSIVSVVFLAFAIYGIVNAATGRARELPIIGKIKLLK